MPERPLHSPLNHSRTGRPRYLVRGNLAVRQPPQNNKATDGRHRTDIADFRVKMSRIFRRLKNKPIYCKVIVIT